LKPSQTPKVQTQLSIGQNAVAVQPSRQSLYRLSYPDLPLLTEKWTYRWKLRPFCTPHNQLSSCIITLQVTEVKYRYGFGGN